MVQSKGASTLAPVLGTRRGRGKGKVRGLMKMEQKKKTGGFILDPAGNGLDGPHAAVGGGEGHSEESEEENESDLHL